MRNTSGKAAHFKVCGIAHIYLCCWSGKGYCVFLNLALGVDFDFCQVAILPDHVTVYEYMYVTNML